MKRVATAVVLIPIVLLAIFRAPLPLLAGIVALVAILAAREFLDIAKAYGVQPFRCATYAFIIVLFAAISIGLGGSKPLTETAVMIFTAGLAAVLAPFLFLALGMRRAELATAYPAAAASVFAFCYIGLPLALLVQVRQLWSGAILILYLLVVVWAGDTFAYYVGRSMGRTRMAPRISPNKTWEGAVASFVGSIVVGTYLLRHALEISTFLLHHNLIEVTQGYLAKQPMPLTRLIVLSALINVAAQLGDLVESALKRGAGIKDSGAILPGHGGMLDRIDALLFAAPVLWYYAALRTIS